MLARARAWFSSNIIGRSGGGGEGAGELAAGTGLSSKLKDAAGNRLSLLNSLGGPRDQVNSAVYTTCA